MMRNQVLTLWGPVCLKLFGIENDRAYSKLDTLLGVKEYGAYVLTTHFNDPPLDPQVKRLLELILTSPHEATLIKMWRIQKGLEA